MREGSAWRPPGGAEEGQAPKPEKAAAPSGEGKEMGGREAEGIEMAEKILEDIADRAREALGTTVKELRALEAQEAAILQEIDDLRGEIERSEKKEQEYSAMGLYHESNAEARHGGDMKRKVREIEKGDGLKRLREKIDEAARDVGGVVEALFGLQRQVKNPTRKRDRQREREKERGEE